MSEEDARSSEPITDGGKDSEEVAANKAKSNKIKEAIQTKRKRGADPSDKSGANDSALSSSGSSSSWSIKRLWKQNMPTYLQKRPPKGMMVDIAVFVAGCAVIYNYGASMNSWIQEQVPSEASLRQKMAEQQAMMQAAQQAQMEAMQGGMM